MASSCSSWLISCNASQRSLKLQPAPWSGSDGYTWMWNSHESGSLFCIFISGPLKIFPDISNLQSSVISHPDCCNKSVKKVVNDKKHVFIRKLTHNYSRNPFQEQWTTLHDYFNTWFWYTNTLISLSATVLVSRMFQLVLFCFFLSLPFLPPKFENYNFLSFALHL